jgi:N-acetylglucosamine-6-phosphate deacetylase
MIPCNIIHDKETLYDNTLQLKHTRNDLIVDNYRLKARVQKLEGELNKKNKVLNDVMSQVGNSDGEKKIRKMQKKVWFK